MAQQYKIVAPLTLDGDPAGPDNYDNYVAFSVGDVVELVPEDDDWYWAPKPGVSVVRIAGKPGSIAQELDFSSLEAL